MKNFIKKFTAVLALVVGTFAVSAQPAAAATAFNNHPNDFATVRVSNYSNNPNCSNCWSSSVSADAGDVVSVAIYYHNNGFETANNTRLKLTPQNTGSGNSHNFTATVYADNAASVIGSATVSITGSSESLSYISNATYWYPNPPANSALLYGQTGSEVFTSNGLRIGNIAPGTQGGATIRFQVSNNGNNNGNAPWATTDNADQIDEDSARLNGDYDMNGDAGTTWFEYGTSSGSLNSNTPNVARAANANGAMSATITGLNDDTTYYFRACAQNSYGTDCGNVENFTTDDDNGGNNNDDDIEVETEPADDIDDDSAVLVGDLVEVGSGNVDRWFEWDTNSSDVSNGDGSTLTVSGTTNSTGEFSRTLTGLNDDTTYYFRACAEDDNGDEDCGSVRSFTTDEDDVVIDNDNESPDVTSLAAFGISCSVGTVNGYYDANGSSTDVWFEWGRTSSLGSVTPRQNKGTGEGSMTYTFTGLAANTTYYFRSVAENNEGIDRGSIQSFRTSSNCTPVVITSGGSGTFLRLQIENGEESVSRGDRLDYEVEWENISGRDLENLVIKIDMPNQVVIEDTTEGNINKKENTVVLNLGDLERGEDGNMTIEVRVKGGVDGEPVVAQATAAFDHPTIEEKTQINAIAYDSDEYDANGTGLGASLFGLFDGNIAGILLILLLLVLIILIARKQFMDHKDRKAAKSGVASEAPVAATGAGTYRPYRPTPIQ